MKRQIVAALSLLILCTGCDPKDAPGQKIADRAQQAINPPTAETAQAAKGRFAPRDECGALEGASDFRQRLARAVQLRDVDALVALSAVDIELDFGGGAGHETLKQRLADSSEPGLWKELEQILTLGCAANEDGGLTVPWMWAQDIGDADPFTSMLVLGEDVPVHAAATPSAKEITTVSWDLVKIAGLQPDLPFQQVTLPGGVSGFIATDKLRSVIDYRLLASRRNGQWRIITLIAGD